MKKIIQTLCLSLIPISIGFHSAQAKTESAAMKRYSVPNTAHELYTEFRYSPVEGLGFDARVSRRDPSNIIKSGDNYYVWYTKSENAKAPWIDGDIWYATSQDGKKWAEQGLAVKRGEKGGFDDRSVFSPNILVAKNKYYLTYQSESTTAPTTQAYNVLAMSVAESPDGPWEKLKDPILLPSADAVIEGDPANRKTVKVIENGSFDSRNVHDSSLLVFKGKYYLYYKGYAWTSAAGSNGHGPFDTMWGLAIADKPEGPYVKSSFNPVLNSGHETFVFPWKNGIAALVGVAGKEANSIQFSEDGVNFEPVAGLQNLPPAAGAYIADQFTNSGDGQGFNWGLCHVARGAPRNFLIRFESDLKQGEKKKTSGRNARYFNTVWDVAIDPEKFGIPAK